MRSALPSSPLLTLQCLFGIYLHALVMRGLPKYKLVCLGLVNAESKERLFSQAKHINLLTTNRKTENLFPAILLSMQAKQTTGEHWNAARSRKAWCLQQEQEFLCSYKYEGLPLIHFRSVTLQDVFRMSTTPGSTFWRRTSPSLHPPLGYWMRMAFTKAEDTTPTEPQDTPPTPAQHWPYLLSSRALIQAYVHEIQGLREYTVKTV